MAFKKRASGSIKSEILHVPNSDGWQYLNDSLTKVAGISKDKDIDLGGFDLKAAVGEHPDHLFVKVFAIKADEVNDNGDCFSAKELEKATETFIDVPVFVNHQNDDVEKARGKVAHAWWDDSEQGIFVINMVDKDAYPQLARGIEEGYIVGSSMGCFVPDTGVLMSDGTYCKIADIIAGDEVISHTGKSQKVINVQIHDDKENDDIYEISAELITEKIKATGEHPFLVLKEQPFCKITNEYIGVPKSLKMFEKRCKKGSYQKEEYSELVKDTNYEFEWKSAKNLKETDILVSPIRDSDEGTRIDADKARLIGLFLAEGNFAKYKGNRSEIQFNFGIHEESTLARDTVFLLRRAFNSKNEPRTYKRKQKNGISVRLSGKEVSDWFYKHCGEYSCDKKLLSEAFEWDKKTVLRVLGGLIDGDGYRRRITDKRSGITIDNYSYTTVSEVLANQIVNLSRLHGIRASLSFIPPRKIGFKNRKSISNTKKAYVISFSSHDSEEISYFVSDNKKIKYNISRKSNFRKADNYLLFPIKNIIKKSHSGQVFNLEVENDNSFIVEGVAVHNCQVGYSVCNICHNKAQVADEFCFESLTPILMSDFTSKPISEIIVGDEVIDAKGKKTFVTQLFKREYKGKMNILKSRAICGELLSTPNHPFMVSCRGEYRYHPVEFIQDKETLFTPIAKVKESNHLLEKYNIKKEDELDFAFLLGIYAAEGSLIRVKGKLKGVEFSLHSEEDDLAGRIKNASINIFNKKPYDYNLSNSKLKTKCRRVRIWNESAAEMINDLCPGTVRKRNKNFNSSVFSLPLSLKKELLGAFIDGDGHVFDNGNVKQIVKSGACLPLMSQIFYMTLHCGASPSMNSYINSGGPHNRDKKTTIYRISVGNTQVQKYEPTGHKSGIVLSEKKIGGKLLNIITDDGLYAKHNVYSVEEIDYDGDVFNFETESHSYVANNTCVHNCSHIKERKSKKFNGSHNCNFHKSAGSPSEKCPLCSCKKGESKGTEHKEAQIYEWNYDIKFIEDSFVVNPACHDCLVCEVLNIPAIEKTSSESVDKLRKVASAISDAITDGRIEKTAGLKEITALNDAMTLMEGVTRSMMAQKNVVSMEYVSDIVEQLAKLQSTSDELVEMGYAHIESPPEAEVIFGNKQQASPVDGGAQQVQDPNAMQASQPQMAGGQPTGVSTTPTGDGIGTVTKPTFSSSKKDFMKIATNIQDSVRCLTDGMAASRQTITSRRKSVFKSEDTYSAQSGDVKIIIAKNGEGESHVAEFNGEEMIRLVSVDALDPKLRTLIASEPAEAARRILAMTTGKDNVTQKTAAGTGVSQDQTEMITQKQLDKANLPAYTKRWDTGFPETITEGADQLAGSTSYHDVSTETPQNRLGSYDVITQSQLEEITDGHLVRWKSFPEVITEKQWDEMSRTVDAVLPDDWTEEIGQAQLLNLRDNHHWADPNVVTQGQLDDQGGTLPYGSHTSRWKGASQNDTLSIIKAASAAVSDAISDYGLSPSDVVSAVNTITSNPQSSIKAARLTLLNAIPRKIEARTGERARRSYFDREAVSKSAVFNKIDGLLCAMADNIEGINADKMVDVVRRIVSDKVAFARTEKSARLAIKQAENIEASVGSDDFSDNLSKYLSDEAMTKVCGTFAEAGTSSKEGSAMANKIFAFAQSQVDEDVILYSVDIDEATGTFEAIVKAVEASTQEEISNFKKANLGNFGDKAAKPFGKSDDDSDDSDDENDNDADEKEEKTARSENRLKMLKEAQMMGGQMPTDLGAGGGGGASMPSAPGGGMDAPVQSFDGGGDDPMGDGGFDEDLLPKPPGSHCPVCTSDDVDVVSGKAKCGNCGSEFLIKVSLEVTKWAGLNDDEGEEGAVGMDDDLLGGEAGEEGEGFALPEGEGLEESIPVAAETRITQHALKKMAEAGVSLGSVSPYSGGTDTRYIGKTADGASEFLCYDSGQRYLVRSAQKDKAVFARWEWAPRLSEPCPTCNRVKKVFANSLGNRGLDMKGFMSLSRKDRGKLILAANKAGTFKRIKTASKNSSITEAFKEVYAFGPGENFPSESCREKLARRFGEDAIALSGPCHGDNLADCVCKSLKNAGVYSNGLAIKVAGLWAERDGCIDCLEDHIRAGFSAEDSSLVCESMKQVFAQAIDLFSDELSDAPMGGDGGGEDIGAFDSVDEGMDDGGFDDGSIFDEEVSPFDGDSVDTGFVSIDLPVDVLEQVSDALNVALADEHKGGDEMGLDGQPAPGGEVEIEIGGDVEGDLGEETGGALDEAVDTAVETVDTLEGEENGDEDSGIVDNTDEDNGDNHDDDTTVFEDDDTTVFEDDESEDDDIFAQNQNQKKESASKNLNRVDSEEEITMKEAFALGQNLKRGRISRTGKIGLDLDGMFATLSKDAQRKLVQKNVQDDSDIQPISNTSKSQMGHEDKLDLDGPDAPCVGTGATMGKESNDLVPDENTEVPAGGGEMGHEKEQGYTAEKGNEFTGGDKGSGNSKATANAHQSVKTSGMRDNLLEGILKAAGEKKLAPSAPHEDDEDIKPVQENKDHSKSGNEIKPREGNDGPDVPERGNSSFMGHEEESIGDVPKSPDHHPEFPAGGGKNPKYDKNDRFDAEKQDRNKGTVIAGRDAESLTARKKAAQTLAGRMLQAGLLDPESLFTKASELERYEPEQIADIEKSLFGGAARKGLNTVSRGTQTPLVINASSNKIDDPALELKGQLQSLFSLEKRNQLADLDEDAQLRKYRH